MTAQFGERLRYQGKEYEICFEPLESYFALVGKRPDFDTGLCSALMRGYQGTWEIVQDRLYLIDLDGFGDTLGDGTEVSLAAVFPDYPERVFAHWYWGSLRIPGGELLDYVHGGYGSTYERDRFIDVERGIVVNTRVVHNGTPDEEVTFHIGSFSETVPRSRLPKD